MLCSIGEWLVFFTLELKHYSADAFWALLLPALGAWTRQHRIRADRRRATRAAGQPDSSSPLRVVVYLGFRQNVEPPGFDDLVLETLGKRGALVTYQGYAEKSRVAVFDLGAAPLDKLVIPVEPGSEPANVPAATGCVGAKPARRW